MKIAICLSGESRTFAKAAANIKHFFSEPEFDFTYFGHTWTTNSWKILQRDGTIGYDIKHLDSKKLESELKDIYPFARFCISNPLGDNWPYVWHSMSYSSMMSNHLKQQYELKNDLKFDLVVHCRYDECRNPEIKFSSYLLGKPIRDDVLYGDVSLFKNEFRQHCINDQFYFGQSRVMDIIEGFYRIYHTGAFFDITNTVQYDHMYQCVGYGVLLYKWATMKNIYIQETNYFGHQIVRRDSMVNDTVKNFNDLFLETEEWLKQF